MVTIFPEGAFSFFSFVEFLSRIASNKLQTLWNHLRGPISHQQMNMIGGDGIVKYWQTIAFLRFKQPIEPSLPVTGKFEKKLPFVTPVGNVPDLTWNMMTIGSGHVQLSLKTAI
jgi:hypothetical protein